MFILLCPGENAPSPQPCSTPAKANCRLGQNQSQLWPRPHGQLGPKAGSSQCSGTKPLWSKPALFQPWASPRQNFCTISRGKWGPFPAGKSVHFPASAPHTSTGGGGRRGVENGHATACKPWFDKQNKKAHHTAPDRNIAGRTMNVLIQTLSCLSGKPHCTTRHALVIANPDTTPSALERPAHNFTACQLQTLLPRPEHLAPQPHHACKLHATSPRLLVLF